MCLSGILKRLKYEVWNVEMLRRNDLMKWQSGKGLKRGKKGLKRIWETVMFVKHEDRRRLVGFEANVLSERERQKGGEVISPPEHIHFTPFPLNFPPDITALLLQAIIPSYPIINELKYFHLHSLPNVSTHSMLLPVSHGDHQRRRSGRYLRAGGCRYIEYLPQLLTRY